MKFLILHTHESLREILCSQLQDMRWRHEWSGFELVAVDGETLTYGMVVELLRQEFDCIIMNLRLPNLLSVRITELVRQLKLPTRVFLWTGAPMVLGPEVKIFDGVVFIPDEQEEFEQRLVAMLGEERPTARKALPNQEHMDAAILQLFKHYRWFPHIGGAYSAFAMYRDCYSTYEVEKPWSNDFEFTSEYFEELVRNGFRETMPERIDRLGQVSALHIFDRLAKTSATICAKLPAQDRRINLTRRHFARLGLGLGLVLSHRRNTVNSLLGDCERVEMIVRPQSAAQLYIPRSLGQSMLNQSEEIPQAHRAITVLTTKVLKLV